MQLKHINFATSDVAGLGAFFERYFAFKPLLERGSGAFMLMSNDEQDPAIYPETFHIGFYVGDPAAVQAKHDELAAAGCSPGEIKHAGGNGRGTHFYCTAPGNVVVEIATTPELHAAE